MGHRNEDYGRFRLCLNGGKMMVDLELKPRHYERYLRVKLAHIANLKLKSGKMNLPKERGRHYTVIRRREEIFLDLVGCSR